MIIAQAGIHEVRSPSVGAREHVHLVAQRRRQTPARPGASTDASVGARIVEPDVMLVSRWRRVRSNYRQSVLAVLQQGSPVNDAKHSMGVRSTR